MRVGQPRSHSMLSEIQDFEGAFDRGFALAAFAMNRHLIDHMLRVGRLLTGDDYEAMVIWGVLAHQNIAHLLPPGSVPSTVLNDHGRLGTADEGIRPLRLRDLAQITRIPRETVRRKLDKLAAADWIERTPTGWIVSGKRTEPLLRDFSRDSVRRFLSAADEVYRVLREADASLASQRALASGAGPVAPLRQQPLPPATEIRDPDALLPTTASPVSAS